MTEPAGAPLSRSELLERLADLVTADRPRAAARAHPTRVAIDGPDGAGKTTLADELAPVVRARGRSVIRASVDDFHRPRADRYQRGPDSAVGYYEDSFDLAALREVLLDPLGPAGDGRYRSAVFAHRTDQPVAEPARLAAADAVLLLDGVFLQRPELRDAWDVTIYLSISIEEMLRRACRRDVSLFGTEAAVEHRYRIRYIPGQELYNAAANPMENADVVVFNDNPQQPVVRR